MSISDAFDDYEADLLADDEPAEIPDLTTAERMLRRVAHLRRERADLQEVRDAEIQRARDWYTKRAEILDGREQFLLDRLAHYHQAVLELDPRKKSISLPSGTLVARAQQPAWTFDPETFVPWLLEHGTDGAIRFKPAPAPEIDASAAKELLTRRDAKGKAVEWGITADGEKPPGVTVEHRGQKFDITLSEEET